MCFGGKDVFLKPVHQGEVVGKPPEKCHRGMRVGIDQAGQNDTAGNIDHPGGVKLGFDQPGWAHRFDSVRPDGDSSGVEAAGIIIQGENQSIEEKDIGFLFSSRMGILQNCDPFYNKIFQTRVAYYLNFDAWQYQNAGRE